MKTQYFLGIDVGKENFHAALTCDGVNFFDVEVANEPEAIERYFKDLKAKFSLDLKQVMVCLEHTGVYSCLLLNYLVRKSIPVYVEPALRIKQSQGMQRGKNDKVDAIRIAKYLFKNHSDLKLWKPKREVVQKLQALLALRDRYVKAKRQFEVPINENEPFVEKSIQKAITQLCKKTLNALAEGLKTAEKEIDLLIKDDPKLKAQDQLVGSVTGVGRIITAYMIVTTNEFQDIKDPKKYACYAGVAPFPHRSGKSVRGRDRVSHLANKKVKTVLHMGARSAIQHSPELKAYYERKLAEGKPHYLVLNNVCNKLISRVFVCINNQRVYEKIYQNALA